MKQYALQMEKKQKKRLKASNQNNHNNKVGKILSVYQRKALNRTPKKRIKPPRNRIHLSNNRKLVLFQVDILSLLSASENLFMLTGKSN